MAATWYRCTSDLYSLNLISYSCIYTLTSVIYDADLLFTATLPTPQVSTLNNAGDLQIGLTLTRPQALGYNSGRFILRYDCGVRGNSIELDYRSAEISSGSSDVVVRRSRSCFVVGEISRVTVWFVSGGHISATPAVTVVNATSGEGEVKGAAWLHVHHVVETCINF